jgi:predicted metal-dependent phosphoesterase TrpH
VTDHDTTSGLEECEIIAAGKGLDFIPGIEFGAKAQRGEIHILGYFIDKDDHSLQFALSDLQEDRKTRAERMVALLCETGTPVSWDRVSELAGGGSVGRPHIAQALVEEGYASHPKDAFDRLINWKSPSYVARKLIQPKEAIDLINGSGGLAVLAHPLESKAKSGRREIFELETTIASLVEYGIVGIEAYYGDYSADQIERVVSLANKYGLVPCGGSDYHAAGNPIEPEPGDIGPPSESVELLKNLKAG